MVKDVHLTHIYIEKQWKCRNIIISLYTLSVHLFANFFCVCVCLQILYVKQPPKETKTESGHVRSLPVYTGSSWSKNTANHFLLYFTWGLTDEIPKGPDIDRSSKSSSSHAGFFNLSRTPYYFTVYQRTTTSNSPIYFISVLYLPSSGASKLFYALPHSAITSPPGKISFETSTLLQQV